MRLSRSLLVAITTICLPTASKSWNIGDTPTEYTTDWFSVYAGKNGAEALIPRERGSIQNFQPAMPLPDDYGVYDASSCPHLGSNLVEWNDPTLIWPSSPDNLAGPPSADGSSIELPPNTHVIIKMGSLSPSGVYGTITIPPTSALIFDDTGDESSAITLQTLGIDVDGALLAGSQTCRITGGIEITLHGEIDNGAVGFSERHLADAAGSNMALKGIVVNDVPGARWDFHGKLYHPTWTRLAAPVPGSLASTLNIPNARDSMLFLQDCVNWPQGGKIVVTTSHAKDTRGYNFNEEAIIAAGADAVQCVSVNGETFGLVHLASPLQHYHHAGEREYQCEVGLLSRNILIQGNEKSPPTDVYPLECEYSGNGWDMVPCENTFLTGFGGHTIIIGQAEGRLRGIEFFRMGMTNILGRYPVHFHRSITGQVGEVSDCSVHESYFRAFTVHDTFDLKVSRNTAFDISGHAYYLESGVEERNTLEYNLAAFVHVIDGALVMPSATTSNSMQSDSILVPADHSASGFYISNVHNYVVGNAASGGWAGIQFPVLPEPADKLLRYNGVVPKDRTSLLITGNSVHSSGWFGANQGAVYAGGALFWDESDVESLTLKYNGGRVGQIRKTRNTKDDEGNIAWFQVNNTTVWLVQVGATGWGKRSEYKGFEVHDFAQKAIFVLFATWMDNVVINCRTSNAELVPDPSSASNEKTLNDGRQWSGFQTYDHLMKHILTNWKISNCGGVARGLQPWVLNGREDTGDVGLFTVPVNGFAPEVQLISSGTQYNWDTLGGTDFVNESIFFAASGSDQFYSMQYMSNWEDADGSMTNRNVGTVMGPARAGRWWQLDDRPGKCEVRSGWKFPQRLCDKDDRKLASMFHIVMPQKTTGSDGAQGSAVLGLIDPAANPRRTRQGSLTHFGLTGNGAVDACTPPEPCDETVSRSWDPDVTGPFNHAQYGGWYFSFDDGTPVHLNIQRVQIPDDAVMIQAMSVPPGTTQGDVRIYATSRGRQYDFTVADGGLAEVRASTTGDTYWLDTANDILYWRVIAGYVENDGTYGWINRAAQNVESFSRGGLTVWDTTGQNLFQLNIIINCVVGEFYNICSYFLPSHICICLVSHSRFYCLHRLLATPLKRRCYWALLPISTGVSGS